MASMPARQGREPGRGVYRPGRSVPPFLFWRDSSGHFVNSAIRRSSLPERCRFPSTTLVSLPDSPCRRPVRNYWFMIVDDDNNGVVDGKFHDSCRRSFPVVVTSGSVAAEKFEDRELESVPRHLAGGCSRPTGRSRTCSACSTASLEIIRPPRGERAAGRPRISPGWLDADPSTPAAAAVAHRTGPARRGRA